MIAQVAELSHLVKNSGLLLAENERYIPYGRVCVEIERERK